MKQILIVIGSVRRGRAADNVLALVQEQVKNYPDFNIKVVDFIKKPLPFFDSEFAPAAEGFDPQNQNVLDWTKSVSEADAVIVLSPEYNHSYTPVLKNAIDWLYEPWKNKPVALIGYGWVGGARAIKHLRDVFGSNIGAKVMEVEANLRFMKEINLDGTPANGDAAAAIKKVLEAVK